MAMKRGVSLYSYQHEYFHHMMNLEDCIKAVSDMGATGVEIIPEQMLNEYPNLSDSFLEKWFGWMKKYNTEPVCTDAFLDMLLYKNRTLTDEEAVQLVARDLKVASQLGCYVIRSLCMTPVRILERSLEYAEKYNVKIGLEIHAPVDLNSPWFEPYQELIDRSGSKWLGIIPDMGVFEKTLSGVHKERAIRDGTNPKIVEYTSAAYDAGVPVAKIVADARRMGAGPKDQAWLHKVSRTVYTDPQGLRKHKDYIFHIHAKFYNMLPDFTDESLDYDSVIPILKEIGFDGYLSSEYEGNRVIEDAFEVNSVEQVSRQHEMFKRMLA